MSTPIPAAPHPAAPTYPRDFVYKTTTPSRMAARGLRPATITAETLFDSLPEDGSVAVRWQSFGHVHGLERFSTHMMRRAVDRLAVEVLRIAPGTRDHLEPLVVYPLGHDRTIRTFVQAADAS